VIHKCLSRDSDQQQDMDKPSLNSEAKLLLGSCKASNPTW
jgi:hypothetical protein